MKRPVLAVAVAVLTASISSCGMLSIPEQTKISSEAAAELVVSELHNDIMSGNIGEFERYFEMDDDTLVFYNKITDEEEFVRKFSKFLSEYLDINADTVSAETVKTWAMSAFSEIRKNTDYTIDRIETESDEADVFVTVSMPDFSVKFDDSIINETVNKIFTDTLYGKDFMEEMAFRKGVSKAELDYTDKPDAFTRDVLEYFSNECNNCYNAVIGDIVSNQPTKSIRLEYSVEKQIDGTWKISDIDR